MEGLLDAAPESETLLDGLVFDIVAGMGAEMARGKVHRGLPLFGDEDGSAQNVDIAGLQGWNGRTRRVELELHGTAHIARKTLQQLRLQSAPLLLYGECHRRQVDGLANLYRLAAGLRPHVGQLHARRRVAQKPSVVDGLHLACGNQRVDKLAQLFAQFVRTLAEHKSAGEILLAAQRQTYAQPSLFVGRNDTVVVHHHVGLAANDGFDAVRLCVKA